MFAAKLVEFEVWDDETVTTFKECVSMFVAAGNDINDQDKVTTPQYKQEILAIVCWIF